MTFLIVIIIVILLLYKYSKQQENFGSGYFHYGKMIDINKGIQDGIKKNIILMKQRKQNMNSNEEKKIENYEPMDKSYNPNKNVVSEYSINEIAPKKSAGEIIIGNLETPEFFKPYNYSDDKKLSEYLEVDGNYTLTNNIGEELNMNEQMKKQKMMENMDILKYRGGNISF